MAIVRWTNSICGALLVIGALVFLAYLMGSIAAYSREPEDVWLSAIWVALLGLLAALCFANARGTIRPPRLSWRALANSAAVIALAVLLVLGRDDPTVPPIVGLCALGPLTALLGGWLRSEDQQA